MKIEMRDPKKLIPYPNNPKQHPQEQIDAIAKSIKEFGFDQPIVVDPSGMIVKGHGRQLAAVQLKLKQVPVIETEGGEQGQLNRLLDNKLASREWDQEMLRADLLDLAAENALDISLFTTDLIPDLAQLTPVGEIGSFNLLTNHQCPSCSYKW